MVRMLDFQEYANSVELKRMPPLRESISLVDAVKHVQRHLYGMDSVFIWALSQVLNTHQLSEEPNVMITLSVLIDFIRLSHGRFADYLYAMLPPIDNFMFDVEKYSQYFTELQVEAERLIAKEWYGC